MKLKKILFLVACSFLILVCIVFLVDFLIYSDEEKLLDILEECKKGIHDENTSYALKYVSNSYKDIFGLSKEDLLKIGEGVFSKFDEFKVIIEKTEVLVESDIATLSISFRMLITYNGQRTFLFGDLNKPAFVKLLFKRSEENIKGWIIIGINELKTRWPISTIKN